MSEQNDSQEQKTAQNVAEALKKELHWFFWVVALGAGLTAYAHTNFATKKEVDDIRGTLQRLDNRIFDLHKQNFPHKHEKRGKK